MRPRYIRPKNLTEALELKASWGSRAKLLAGGTDLVVHMHKGLLETEALIDLTALRELRGIREAAGYISIGALATYVEIIESPLVAAHAAVLRQAAEMVGSAQIRFLGTLGGNLGNASPAGDTLPPLYVLDAKVRLVNQGGERLVGVSDFILAPGKTILNPDELIAEIQLPVPENPRVGSFNKIGQRKGLFIAKASAAVLLEMKQEKIQCCAIALGAVAPTVIRVPQAEEFLIHKKLDDDTIREASRMAAEASRPITDIRSTEAYRRQVVGVIVKRGLEKLAMMGKPEVMEALG